MTNLQINLRICQHAFKFLPDTVSDKTSWNTLTKRCFFPSRDPLIPLKVLYRGLVTKSCTPTLRRPQSVPTILTDTVGVTSSTKNKFETKLPHVLPFLHTQRRISLYFLGHTSTILLFVWQREKERIKIFFSSPFWMTHFHLLKGKKSHVLTKTWN